MSMAAAGRVVNKAQAGLAHHACAPLGFERTAEEIKMALGALGPFSQAQIAQPRRTGRPLAPAGLRRPG